MPKSISLNLRQAMYASGSGDIEVFLVTIDHEDLDEPVRLSSDPTQRLSSDPLVYGTISNGEQYLFAGISILAPDEEEGTPPTVSLVFETVSSDLIGAVRSTTARASLSLAIVSSANADFVEEAFTGLKVVRATYNANRLTVEASRDSFTGEPWPAQRMSKSRFPGLFP